MHRHWAAARGEMFERDGREDFSLWSLRNSFSLGLQHIENELETPILSIWDLTLLYTDKLFTWQTVPQRRACILDNTGKAGGESGAVTYLNPTKWTRPGQEAPQSGATTKCRFHVKVGPPAGSCGPARQRELPVVHGTQADFRVCRCRFR